MRNKAKAIGCTVGIVVGLVIMIVGFSLHDTTNYSIGESIKFGADFYTEMYSVTKDVGRAINYAINDLIRAVGWLIVAIGAIDICLFAYNLIGIIQEDPVNSVESRLARNVESIDRNVQLLAEPIQSEIAEQAKREAEETARRAAKEAQREAEALAKRDAEERAKREAEEKAKQEAEEKKKQEAVPKEKTLSEKLTYALKFQTDDGMINYLNAIDHELVKDALNAPKHTIRSQIETILKNL